jgi:hypothetical protein
MPPSRMQNWSGRLWEFSSWVLTHQWTPTNFDPISAGAAGHRRQDINVRGGGGGDGTAHSLPFPGVWACDHLGRLAGSPP